MVHRHILNTLLGLAMLLLSTGCALTTETIHIDYRPKGEPAKVAGAEGIQVKLELKDLRPKPDREVGRKINGFGSEMAPILNDEDVLGLVRRAVEQELKACGYSLENGKVPLNLELTAFMHRYTTGFWSGDSEATVTLVGRIQDAEGRVLWTGSASDSFKHAAGVFTGANVKQAYEEALPGAIRKLFGKPDLHEALAKAARAAGSGS